jgi:biopolymer transport protein ExbD
LIGMAIKTQSGSTYSAMSEINVTPLVDVMLVLLVIFIVTAPLLMQSVKVNLPKTAPVPKLAPAKAVQLTINEQGKVFVDAGEVPVEQLEEKLKTLAATHPDLSIQLRGDERIAYGRIAEVMAAVHRAGIAKLSFITAALPPGAPPAATPAAANSGQSR